MSPIEIHGIRQLNCPSLIKHETRLIKDINVTIANGIKLVTGPITLNCSSKDINDCRFRGQMIRRKYISTPVWARRSAVSNYSNGLDIFKHLNRKTSKQRLNKQHA